MKRSWSLLGAPGARLGALLGGPWGSWGGFGRSWWCLGGVPRGSWGALGASWTKSFVILKNLQKPKEINDFWLPGASRRGPREVPDASWRRLGASWSLLEASWRRLGASWVRLGASGGRLDPSWGHLGRSWGRLGRVLERSWTVQDRSKTRPRRPKTRPGPTKMVPRRVKTPPGRPKTHPRGPKTLPGGSKMLPRCPETAPRGIRDLPGTPPGRPREAKIIDFRFVFVDFSRLAWFLCIPCTALSVALQGLCGSPVVMRYRVCSTVSSWGRLGRSHLWASLRMSLSSSLLLTARCCFLLCFSFRYVASPCLSLRIAVLLG